jgi:hypothetical protein
MAAGSSRLGPPRFCKRSAVSEWTSRTSTARSNGSFCSSGLQQSRSTATSASRTSARFVRSPQLPARGRTGSRHHVHVQLCHAGSSRPCLMLAGVWLRSTAALDEEEQPGSTGALLGCSTSQGCHDPGELRRHCTGIDGRRFSRKRQCYVTPPPRRKRLSRPGPPWLPDPLREQHSRRRRRPECSPGSRAVVSCERTLSSAAPRRRRSRRSVAARATHVLPPWSGTPSRPGAVCPPLS